MFDNAQPDHRWPPRTNHREMGEQRRRAVDREWPLSATKNGELWLLNQEVARAFFSRVLAQAKPHMSDEHFPARKSFQNLSLRPGASDRPCAEADVRFRTSAEW